MENIMTKSYETIFKTAPDKTFKEYFNESMQNTEDELNEAKKIVREAGCRVINEGKLAKIIIGAALSLGLITNAMASEFNAHANPTYTSKTATTTSLSKEMQKDYNLKSDLQMTDQMIWNIADIVSQKLTKRMLADDKYELEDLIALEEWQRAVEFYKTLKVQDESLANMFSRRLDKSLTKSLQIAPNIERYVG